jgi:hypothetical protein
VLPRADLVFLDAQPWPGVGWGTQVGYDKAAAIAKAAAAAGTSVADAAMASAGLPADRLAAWLDPTAMLGPGGMPPPRGGGTPGEEAAAGMGPQATVAPATSEHPPEASRPWET